MKHTKRMISMLLALVMLMLCSLTVLADDTGSTSNPDTTEYETSAPQQDAEPLILGDADLDRVVTIFDATLLQRYLAGWVELVSSDAVSCSEVDGDGYITILDVTAIQQYLAHINNGYDTGELLSVVLEKRAEEERRRQEEEEKRKEEEEKQQKIKEIIARINAYETMKGVDISSMNGAVDMNKLKAAGYQFVMIRCGYGSDYTSQDDSRFETNVKNAEAAGLYWGTYLYSYALTTAEAKSEVSHTLRLLKGKKPTMPIAFDMEDGDGYKAKYGMPSNATLASICKTYLSGIKEAGYYPILYTSTYWLNHIVNDKALVTSYDLWVAQWNSVCEYKADNVGMWQYGGETNFLESPTIPGLSGIFDKNFCYKDYPDIIMAYGYNNWPAIVEKDSIAGVSAQRDDEKEQAVRLPEGYHGYMGMTRPR